jgi:hypothetical protein
MRVFILLIAFVSLLFSQEHLVLVANKNFPISAFNKHQVKQIFLKRTLYIDTMTLVPLNLPSSHPLRQRFEKSVLKMSMRQLREYWTKAHYQGKRPPLVQHSIQSIIVFIREVDGSIAYLPSSQVPDDFRILYKVKP